MFEQLFLYGIDRIEFAFKMVYSTVNISFVVRSKGFDLLIALSFSSCKSESIHKIENATLC